MAMGAQNLISFFYYDVNIWTLLSNQLGFLQVLPTFTA